LGQGLGCRPGATADLDDRLPKVSTTVSRAGFEFEHQLFDGAQTAPDRLGDQRAHIVEPGTLERKIRDRPSVGRASRPRAEFAVRHPPCRSDPDESGGLFPYSDRDEDQDVLRPGHAAKA
jgi:hypothetical protein